MSTVMYAYRIDKDKFWSFTASCRKFYLEHHPVLSGLASKAAERVQKMSETPDSADVRAFMAAVDNAKKVALEWSVELQVFDEGDTYLIRPLEVGWFFLNNFRQFAGADLTEVFVDDRSDRLPENVSDMATARWVDEKSDARQYMLYPVVDTDDFVDAATHRR